MRDRLHIIAGIIVGLLVALPLDAAGQGVLAIVAGLVLGLITAKTLGPSRERV